MGEIQLEIGCTVSSGMEVLEETFLPRRQSKKKIQNDSFGMNCTANSGKKKVMRNDRGRTSGGCWGKDLFIYLL